MRCDASHNSDLLIAARLTAVARSMAHQALPQNATATGFRKGRELQTLLAGWLQAAEHSLPTRPRLFRKSRGVSIHSECTFI